MVGVLKESLQIRTTRERDTILRLKAATVHHLPPYCSSSTLHNQPYNIILSERERLVWSITTPNEVFKECPSTQCPQQRHEAVSSYCY